MALWLLKAIDPNGGPWSPFPDKTFGLIVRAETEEAARRIAGEVPFIDPGSEVWADNSLVLCSRLTDDGAEGVILVDTREA